MLEELKTFITVVEYESFTKAGEKINLSQPSVSVHIKNLESYFNTKLITRSVKQKNIMITESGHLLYRRGKEILRLLEATKEELEHKPMSLKGPIKIGASFTIGEYILPDFLKEFFKEYEDVEIELVIDNTANICHMVKGLKLDFGLVEGIASSFEFYQEYFLQDNMVLMLPYNHPLLKEEFSYNKLQNFRWITREYGSGTREYLNLFLTTNKITPKSIIVLGSNYSVKEAVKNGLGITLVSNYVAREGVKNKEVSIIEMDKNYKRHFSYILSKDTPPSKASEIFIEKLKNYSKLLKE